MSVCARDARAREESAHLDDRVGLGLIDGRDGGMGPRARECVGFVFLRGEVDVHSNTWMGREQSTASSTATKNLVFEMLPNVW